VARELARGGVEVCAIVGTNEQSVESARAGHRDRHGLQVTRYTSLAELLLREQIDTVAICSPAEAHLPDLDTAVAAGCHVLCEKPLWWAPDMTRQSAEQVEACATRLVEASEAEGRYLALQTQWPYTLPAFRELHPDVVWEGRAVAEVSMWLGPTGKGAPAVVESGSHLLSLLHALVGAGRVEEVEAASAGDGAQLAVRFVYAHAQGRTRAELSLTQTLASPRPAGYRVDGRSVERRVELPDYRISFAADDRSIPLLDPLAARVGDFIRCARDGQRPDRTSLIDGILQLRALVAAVEGLEE